MQSNLHFYSIIFTTKDILLHFSGTLLFRFVRLVVTTHQKNRCSHFMLVNSSEVWTCITFANELLFSMLFKTVKTNYVHCMKRTLVLGALMCSWSDHCHHLAHNSVKKGAKFLLCPFADLYLHRYSLFFNFDFGFYWRYVSATWILFDTCFHSSTTKTICVWVSHMSFGLV